ncbi:MAG TPA: F0F1 ATP synthase subunit alpha, partial [Longimicrobiales bacterium]
MATEAQLRAGEIKGVLLREIEGYTDELKVEEVGAVLEVKDGVARIFGLTNAMASEMLEITSAETGDVVTALALNLEEDNIGAVIMGDWTHLQEGDAVRRTGRVLDIPVGAGYIGRVVDALGNPLDGQGEIASEGKRFIDVVAPGIVLREPVKQPMQTGIKAIDSMIPIGRGQRELIIGDRTTGKTAILVDTILNQRDQDLVCIYVAIGQKASTVAQVHEKLKDEGAMDYTIIVNAAASEAAPIKWMAP